MCQRIRKNEKGEEGVYKMNNGLIVLDEPIDGLFLTKQMNNASNEFMQN